MIIPYAAFFCNPMRDKRTPGLVRLRSYHRRQVSAGQTLVVRAGKKAYGRVASLTSGLNPWQVVCRSCSNLISYI
jgi:hypothetical protein